MIDDPNFRSILESLPQVVLVASPLAVPETGQHDFLIEFVNPAWESLSGALASTVIGKRLSDTIYAKTDIPWAEMGCAILADGKTCRHTLYSPLLEKWLDISLSCIDGKLLCLHLSDVTELKQSERRLKEQNLRLSSLSAELTSSRNNLKMKLEKIENLNTNLEQLAYFDRMTGLPNRLRFNSILEEELDAARRSGSRFALAIMDVDNLKNLNDSMGHDSGDELLHQLAQRLGHFQRSDVQASRFGGDEFLLIIHNYEHDAALLHMLNNIQEVLGEPYMIFNAELKSTVSIGVATFPDDADTVKDLLKYSDIAMTDAKRRGKNTLSLFHSVMQENLMNRLKIEQKMFRALEDEQFQLFFQPQFDVGTKQLRGFEALVRWFDAELGYISPDRFIPLAEENRIIISLGDWIMRTACRTLHDWQERFGFQGILSVNVSPVQLQATGFIDDLRSILEENQLKPQTLEIEITEGVLIKNFDDSIRLLEEIKELGVGISLDDFGTGYSSLSYLQFLPLTTLKIDKSFIANITREKSIEYDITDAIVSLVNKLGIDTIAEGVETDEQLSVIRRINCKTIQGFLTGRPMPYADCERLIEAGSYSLS